MKATYISSALLVLLLLFGCENEEKTTQKPAETAVVSPTTSDVAPITDSLLIDPSAEKSADSLLLAEIPTTNTVDAGDEKAVEEEQKPKKKRKRRRKKAKVQFKQTVYDYKTIKQGDKVEYKFQFKNTGKAELVVKNVKASCGCTQPSYPFIPIAPGEEGYIGVVFDTKGKLGKQKPMITVETNADPPTYKLYLEGYVDAD